MNKIIALVLAALLTSCSKHEPAENPKPEPTATVESLVANPERLKELRQQCKTERAKLGDELCNRVAEATNKRFLGDGMTPYASPKEQPKF